ncbi:hypothetical protein A3H65_00995 [Candidatus Giovannonibacteria bacterium RIFCSPLOWO2_02_FULL_45_14]|uniref:Cation-transporting P-type ATPase N-terminal domain-containing protein n=1 Tax=Candidatus Giovannonibacteria bacterium RIFCSPLOWO2_12_FULL_44_15 TaxID=1798364 RepID=A0A1F5XZT8_9BACT|nr:MAG: hypothetical protein A3C75_01420 [Candidatus Giovannonibacteria bacterium RIFCSPHIGHO2_02_FULL_44_31]OGF76022.1 MAG: hypothetical protein A3E62_01830 [Candidatus Giovannonibacteria bacterium RIFCSPHIGHO2_12_FULL_44_29]OGF90918.1 MAG: hypothetical protein A3H65_00995 [Candidatus Giovannonibacteria bacterium RIFCSPLOWO2_02_FULL_45_14]OGF93438.1 MAG: hypothetical protein A3G54_04065 [Candidatus Giovannonibacteria bacterium RIFCSPLOWO2_12_FULL_44_15]
MADYYQLSVEDVFKATGSNKDGLSEAEYKKKFLEYGPNELPKESGFRALAFIWGQIKSPLVYILIIASILAFFAGEKLDTIIILVSVVINIGIGFYQEYSSSQILKRLAEKVRVSALVKRNGEIKEIDSAMLVPGDVVIIKSGMRVPADARLIKAKDLATNEALLTGESSSVKKNIEVISQKTGVADRKNMVFMGSSIERGEGEAIVVKTGKDTEIGAIALLTKESGEEITPLQEKIGSLGKFLSILVVIASIVIIVVGIYEKFNFYQIFITAVAVAVAAIPEGLPAAIAVVLAVASKNIFKNNGLVKKLLAAETLGSVSILLTDKTGTLTEGRMKVEKIIAKDEGSMLSALALANEAIIENDNGKIAVKGEATDRAKLEIFLEKGLDLKKILEVFPRVNFLPFDSARKIIASFHTAKNTHGEAVQVFITGEPEFILEKSINFSDKKDVLLECENLARKGFRVIAAAEEALPISSSDISKKSEVELFNLVKHPTFLGLAVISDPIRADVKETVREVRSAGIKIIMLTGDHKLTARTIGQELGFSAENIMEGSELENISGRDMFSRIKDVEIFARVDPKHKILIAKAWKEKGEAVAMTGDGINDAPALKYADIGIALNSGTDVTKEASDLVLIDDGLSTIAQAIKYGRTAFDNIKKVVIYLLASSFTEITLVLGSLILRVPLPMTAVQILWTNIVQDGFPNFALAFEKGEDGIMRRKPMRRTDPILDKKARMLSFSFAAMTDIILLSIFYYFLEETSFPIEYIRTIIFTALGTSSLFYIFSIKSLNTPIYKTNLFDNNYLLFAVGIGFVMMTSAVYIPALNTILKTAPLHPVHVMLILALGIFKIILMELMKWFYNRKTA